MIFCMFFEKTVNKTSMRLDILQAFYNRDDLPKVINIKKVCREKCSNENTVTDSP